MKEAVHQMICRHQLLRSGETIIVAVSGGPDSMALLHFLWNMRKRYHIDVRACHLNHQLRGDEASEDASFVKAYCKDHGICLYQKELNVKKYAKERKVGTQLAARELRYQWFSQLLATIPNSCIATGHHGDDQVETMMMRLIRGTTPIYSFGIPVQRKLGEGRLIRPFLGVTKMELEAYCREEGLSSRHDSSNDSNVYTRNRIRHELLPILKKENPNIHVHMQRQNEWMSEDQHFLMKQAEELLPSMIVNKSDQKVTISRPAFLSAALPLQRRLIHLILSYLCGRNSPKITSIHIEQVLALLVREHPSSEYHLAETLYVRREYDVCHFLVPTRHPAFEREQTLPIRGQVSMYQWFFESFVTTDCHVVEADHQIVLDLDDVTTPLIVRTRRADDRIACRGMEGTKKVGRLFIDRKIPKQERERWPLLVDGEGRILWVPFLHRTRFANVGPSTNKKLVISCHRNDEMC